MGCNASIVHLCAAYATFSSKGSRKIVVKTCLRMAKPPEYLGTAVSCHLNKRSSRSESLHRAKPKGSGRARHRVLCDAKPARFWLASLLIRSPEANIPG